MAPRIAALAELEAGLAILRTSTGAERKPALTQAAKRLRLHVIAGDIREDFVRAALEETASRCGLIRDVGLLSVRDVIEAALHRSVGCVHPQKSAGSSPRDLSARDHAAGNR